MEHGTEDSIVNRLGNLLLSFQLLDTRIIELGRAFEITLKTCSRKCHLLYLLHIILSLFNVCHSSSLHLTILDDISLHWKIEMILKLLDISTLLTRLQALCARICQKPHILCARYHPIEIICPHSILILICRQPKAFSQLRRNE